MRVIIAYFSRFETPHEIEAIYPRPANKYQRDKLAPREHMSCEADYVYIVCLRAIYTIQSRINLMKFFHTNRIKVGRDNPEKKRRDSEKSAQLIYNRSSADFDLLGIAHFRCASAQTCGQARSYAWSLITTPPVTIMIGQTVSALALASSPNPSKTTVHAFWQTFSFVEAQL